MKSLIRVQLFATPWTAASQAPPSRGFSRQEYWSGLPFPSPGDLPDSGIEPRSPTLQAGALPSKPPGKPQRDFLSICPTLRSRRDLRDLQKSLFLSVYQWHCCDVSLDVSQGYSPFCFNLSFKATLCLGLRSQLSWWSCVFPRTKVSFCLLLQPVGLHGCSKGNRIHYPLPKGLRLLFWREIWEKDLGRTLSLLQGCCYSPPQAYTRTNTLLGLPP